MADVAAAPVGSPIKVEKKKKTKEGRSKRKDSKKAKTGEDATKKKKKKRVAPGATPDSDDADSFQEVDIDLGTPLGEIVGHATPDSDPRFHNMTAEGEDSDSALPHSGLSHTRVESTDSRPGITTDGLALNVPNILRSDSSRCVSHRHSVRTSYGGRRSMALALDDGNATRLAAVSITTGEGEDASLGSECLEERMRVIDLDSGRPVDLQDVPSGTSARENVIRQPNVKATGPPALPPRTSPTPPVPERKRSYWATPGLAGARLAGVGGAASNLTSGISRGLAAGFAAVRGPTLDLDDGHEQKIRLPRREVDEDQLAEDVMRFADARHIFRSENNIEVFRDLGLRLEQAWRAKLSEEQDLRVRLEETQDVLEDLEDENGHLRDQLGLLSEQIVSREDTFQEFQRVTVKQHERERLLWTQEVKEEKENALIQVAEFKTLLTREKSLSAQLRLIIHSIKSGRLDVLEKVDLDDAREEKEGAVNAPSNGMETFAGLALEGAASSPAGQAQGKGTSPGEGDEAEEDIGEDVLYNLNDARDPTDTNTSVAMMNKDNPMSLEAMRQAGLIDGNLLLGLSEEVINEPHTNDPVAETKAAVAVASRVLFDKAAADAALIAALQEENATLRGYHDAKDRRYRDMHAELAKLRQELAATEAAVDEVLDG